MSTTEAVDLRQLAVRNSGPPTPPPRSRRSHLMTRYVLPAVVLLGFLSVLAWAARDSLMPGKPVTVVPVMTTRADVKMEGTPLFDAAGWVEPRPTPVLVTALAEGIVDRLLVVEGQEVKAGNAVAHLIDRDVKLALKTAEVDLKLRQAELRSVRATFAAGWVNLLWPAHLKAALAEAEAMLAEKQTEHAVFPFQIESTRARLRLARLNYQRKTGGSDVGVVPGLQLEQARCELDIAEQTVKELESRLIHHEREIEVQKTKRDALQARLTLKTDERRHVEDSQAQLEAAQARVDQATIAVETAQLRLERMKVTAPIDGRVMALVARPGQRLMGQAAQGMADASTVVSLYDPKSLQVRADVRLEDVPRVQPGQAVQIVTPAAPGGPLVGEVLFATSQADLQKNTLQVKVLIKSPPPTLRPDMLVSVTFLAPPGAKSASVPGERLRMFIPRTMVETGDGGARVWVADQAGGVAKLRSVKLGAIAGELVEVVEGLKPSDKLIASGRDGLSDGDRIRVKGEEAPPDLPPAGKPQSLPRLK